MNGDDRLSDVDQGIIYLDCGTLVVAFAFIISMPNVIILKSMLVSFKPHC